MPDLTPIKAVPKKRVRKLEPIAGDSARAASSGRLAPVGNVLSGPIFTRARDIIAANVNDLLERSEDPAKMIRMMILEMEDVLSETRATAARSIADLKEMRSMHARLDGMAESWEERATLALEKDREDLARQALVEKARITDMIDGLGAEMQEIETVLKGYEADIQRLQAKLGEARARQASIATRIERAMSKTRTREMLYGGRTEEAFARFDELERRADVAEGEADAAAMGARSLEDEIADLKAEEQVDAELEKLKQKQREDRAEGEQG